MSERAACGCAPESARLTLISGSLRAGSLNTAVLRTAAALARAVHPGVRLSTFDIARLPLFNADLAASAAPEVAGAFLALRRSHGLLISTPEYNGNPPGALMNMLDWLSHSVSSGPLQGLPVATASASPDVRGGIRAQQRLREVLERCGARIVADPVLFCRATGRLGEGGIFAGSEVPHQLAAAVTALLAATAPQLHRCTRHAIVSGQGQS